MGQYADKLRQHWKKTPKIGYCALCNSFGKLTGDHVPPKACGNVSKHIVQAFPEAVDAHRSHPRMEHQNGVKFNTICKRCNGDLLGALYDPEFTNFVDQIRREVNRSLESPIAADYYVDVTFKPQLVARAVLGHLFAVVSKQDLISEPNRGEITKLVQAYFADDSAAFPEEFELYCWAYPRHNQFVANNFGVIPNLVRCKNEKMSYIFGGVMKFFPVAFWFVYKSEGVVVPFRKLIKDKNISRDGVETIRLDLRNLPSKYFPEYPDKNGSVQFTEQTLIARPV